jgi:hypothetical protein
MLEFAGVMSAIDPAQITTYQIEARGDTIQGNSVLVPRISGDNMQAILAVFRGQATIADAPDQQFEADSGTEGVEAPVDEGTVATAEAMRGRSIDPRGSRGAERVSSSSGIRAALGSSGSL